jgi:hypothetical protein
VLAGHAAVAECAVRMKDALKVWIGDGVRRRSARYPIEFQAFSGVPRKRGKTPGTQVQHDPAPHDEMAEIGHRCESRNRNKD